MSEGGRLEPQAGLSWINVQGYRTLVDATLHPGPVCALVGEANTGKSNLLAAVRTLLDPGQAPLTPGDSADEDIGRTVIRGGLVDGTEVSSHDDTGFRPPVLFFPASLRSRTLVAPTGHPGAEKAVSIVERNLAGDGASTTRATLSMVRSVEEWCEAGVTDTVLVIEEPELFLTPQTGRYLYRLLRHFSACGNQVLYSTHSPALLNVAHLEELAVTERHHETGTTFTQPLPLEADEAMVARSEFDAERSELFLARSVVLVEGMTEKLVFPFVFATLGHDVDQERISVVECGGKGGLPLFVRICRASRIPCVVVHDRDAPDGEEPILAERQLNALIQEAAGEENTVALAPDFEGVAGIHHHDDKVLNAYRRFVNIDPGRIPPILKEIVETAVELAGQHGLLFRRNSQTGAVETLVRTAAWGTLNPALHTGH